jgi:hypothetical protein
MKRNVLNVFFIIILTLSGCEKDGDKFTSNRLYQSQWRGSLKFKENEISKECSIIISFETLSTGRYICDELEDQSSFSKQTSIEYEIENNIISIYGGLRNILSGDWWIKESSGNKLILKREPNSEYESTLIINKL